MNNILKKNKLFIWDFDGVLFDSLRECIIVLRISIELLKDEKLDIDDLDIDEICFDRKTDHLLWQMKRLRPFIIKGQDYIWQYLNMERFNIDLKNFDKYKLIFDEIYTLENDIKYEYVFYKARNILQNFLKNKYFYLFKSYENSLNALKESLKFNINYICSARDIYAINFLLNLNDIYFDKKKIFTKDFNMYLGKGKVNKLEQIKQIIKQEKYHDKEFYLVEDQLKIPLNLLTEFPKMTIVYAKYGYGLNNDEMFKENKSILSIENGLEINKLIY